MKSPVVKRSIVVAGHKTSVSLEEAFWNGMKEISGLRDMTLSELVGEIDSNRQQGNLSSAIRLFVLDYFRTRAAAAQSHFLNRHIHLFEDLKSVPQAKGDAFKNRSHYMRARVTRSQSHQRCASMRIKMRSTFAH